MRIYIGQVLMMGMLLALLTACGASGSAPLVEQLTTAPDAVAQAATPTPVASSTPFLTPTQPGPLTLSIWWPEPLAPLDNSDAADLLSEQISGFQTTEENVLVALRLKSVGEVGGIMSTLRSANAVAPGALPDLTLIRRSDLLLAMEENLIYPLEGLISSAILGDLYEQALALGQIEGHLYGLPYVLTVQHMAYLPDAVDTPISWRFDDLLADGPSFVFPVSQVSRVNGLFLALYTAAGGTLSGEIAPGPLLRTFEFFETARVRGIIPAEVTSYTSINDYIADLIEGDISAGLINSTIYMNLLQNGDNLGFGPLPTEGGTTLSEVDGWMWVLTTSSVDRQALVRRYLNWMMNANRQGDYARTINMLPSQRGALQSWPDSPYHDFLRSLLPNAVIPVSEREAGQIVRALQNGLLAVLNGQSTAEEATQSIIAQLGG